MPLTEDITIRAATVRDLGRWHSDYLCSGGKDSVMVICCFGGDRLSAVADGGAFFARDADRHVVGVVSYSPSGEGYGSNQPAIIGLWVDRAFRRRQTGRDLAAELVRYAVVALRKLVPGCRVRVDVVTRDANSVMSPGRLGDELFETMDIRRFL